MSVMAQTQPYFQGSRTPGFFSSAIAADEGENIFDCDFGKLHGSMEQQHDVFGNGARNNLFLQTQFNPQQFDQDFGFGPHPSSSRSLPPYHNPLQHMPSPPSSAKLEPVGWPYSNLPAHDLDGMTTHDPSAFSRVQYGQVTPPDDQSPEDFGDYQHQQVSFDHEMPSVLEKPVSQGKRDFTAATASAAAAAKRPRKNTRGKGKKTLAANQALRESQQALQAHLAVQLPDPDDEKRSKFLERNRVAASKCRQKKKEWTNNLEARARELQSQKSQLVLMVNSLRDETLFLKGEMLKHVNCDCANIREFLANQAQHIAETGGLMDAYRHRSPVSSIGSAPSSTVGSRRGSLSYGCMSGDVDATGSVSSASPTLAKKLGSTLSAVKVE